MDESLEELYFNWLYAKIHLSDIPYNSYSELLRVLYKTEFVWLVSGDDNRAEDGIDLRKEYMRESKLGIDSSWFDDGCSVLEMLVAFSRRAEFQTDIGSREWFWQFISNMNLSGFHDDEMDEAAVASILYNFVWRTYEFNGSGGMFPMTDPAHDQTRVEIWYQFCEYIAEMETL